MTASAPMAINLVETSKTDSLMAAQEIAPDPFEEILDKLSYCESRHNPMALNPDDPVGSGSPSKGLFQFKDQTWHYYLDRYGLFSDTERAERENLIWDGYAQKAVVRLILSEPGGWRNWTNCGKSIGIETFLAEISHAEGP